MVVSTSAKDWWIVHVGVSLPGTECQRNAIKSKKQNCRGKREDRGGWKMTEKEWGREHLYCTSLMIIFAQFMTQRQWEQWGNHFTCLSSAESISNRRVKFWLHWSEWQNSCWFKWRLGFPWVPRGGADGQRGSCPCLHGCVRLHQDLKSFSSPQFPETYEGFEHHLMLQIAQILSQKW